MTKRNDIVQTWFDEGCGAGGYVFGLVTKAGAKTYTVQWESGIVNRVRQGETHNVQPVPARMLDEARKALKLPPPHLLVHVYESRLVGVGGYVAECSCGKALRAISEDMVRIRFGEHVAETAH